MQTPTITPELLTAGRDACAQVRDDFIRDARDLRDSFHSLSDDLRAIALDDLQTAHHWNRMSVRFERARQSVEV